MTDEDNYPMGAKDDPRAPWNEQINTDKEIEVEVTIICECCRNIWQEVKTVVVKDDDSPDKMRLPVSSCKECPDFFRAMTHEQLVSLCLAAHNPSIRHAYPRTTSQVKLAKKLSPEEILTFKAN